MSPFSIPHPHGSPPDRMLDRAWGFSGIGSQPNRPKKSLLPSTMAKTRSLGVISHSVLDHNDKFIDDSIQHKESAGLVRNIHGSASTPSFSLHSGSILGQSSLAQKKEQSKCYPSTTPRLPAMEHRPLPESAYSQFIDREMSSQRASSAKADARTHFPIGSTQSRPHTHEQNPLEKNSLTAPISSELSRTLNTLKPPKSRQSRQKRHLKASQTLSPVSKSTPYIQHREKHMDTSKEDLKPLVDSSRFEALGIADIYSSKIKDFDTQRVDVQSKQSTRLAKIPQMNITSSLVLDTPRLGTGLFKKKKFFK